MITPVETLFAYASVYALYILQVTAALQAERRNPPFNLKIATIANITVEPIRMVGPFTAHAYRRIDYINYRVYNCGRHVTNININSLLCQHFEEVVISFFRR